MKGSIFIKVPLYFIVGPIVILTCTIYELFSVYVLRKTIEESYWGKNV